MWLLFIIIIVIFILLTISGSSENREILNLLETYQDQHGRAVLKHLNEHFDEKFSSLEEAVRKICSKYAISSMADFIHLAAISQYVFLDTKRAAVFKYSYTMPISREMVRELERLMEKFCDAEDRAKFLLRAHKFYLLKDAALKMPIAKLKKEAQKNPEKIFDIDLLPYIPFVESFCKIKGKSSGGDLAALLKMLYADPKLFPYSEISQIYTIKDLADYFRRKMLGFDYSELKKLREENTALKIKVEKAADDLLRLKEDLDLEKALRASEKTFAEEQNRELEELEEINDEKEELEEINDEKGKEELEEN